MSEVPNSFFLPEERYEYRDAVHSGIGCAKQLINKKKYDNIVKFY